MEQNIQEILSHFGKKEAFTRFEKVNTGHINDSYRIFTSDGTPGYFLQRINHHIFKDVDGLMENIRKVTRHLAGKLAGNPQLSFRVLEIIPATDGKLYVLDPDGQYWRLYNFIDRTHGYNLVENTRIAREGGQAFGTFMSLLADLPTDGMTEIIPGFHDMEKRLAAFHKVMEADAVDRAASVSDLIRFVRDREEQMLRIPALIRKGELPSRITHNDTKFNNILFNEQDEAVCVVDLDTVMPGTVLFDFGDAIRTGANTADEDEKDLSKVDINLPVYEAYTRGFIASTGGALTETETENLAFSARVMTFIIGLRFLTDYLDGDHYFRIRYEGHNLDRARVQFRLVEAMESKAVEMNRIVAESSRSVTAE
jgi:Ser/Thr protein kinase RdoA (MazF antagonist)